MLHLPRQPAGEQALRCRAYWCLSTLISLFMAVALLPAGDRAEPHHITAVRFWSLGDVTRIAIESDGDFSIRSDRLENPERLFFDLVGAKPTLGPKGMTVIPVSDTLVRQIRVAETQHGVTRVVLDLERSADATTSHLDNPNRLIIEVRATGAPAPATPNPPIEAEVAESRAPAYRPFTAPPASAAIEASARRTAPLFVDPPPIAARPGVASDVANVIPKLSPPPVRPAPAAVLAKVTPAASPIAPSSAIVPAPAPETAALPAKRNSTGGRSMIRVLGLKVGRIVIDPGHGGHDTGTMGPEGLREKDLVLDVSKRLGALIEERMNSEVIYTRSDDTFIPLEQRTEIANQAKADLFLSIHANSSPIPSAAGVETYYLNFTTSKAALDLAARENAGSQKSIFELQDLLEKIALRDKVDESREFANRIQSALYSFSVKNDVHSRDRGVRKAPFVVLIGASMPSVLAEIGFISNAHDESIMKKAEYRQRLAESLYKGVASYAATLSHFQVAQKR
ncbi:MAG: N-acetylmuramoyl-L-alanine amidase [Bryobacteraceae bacterium]|jgi:N-acetylmuramoyl-L-alanine amidase